MPTPHAWWKLDDAGPTTAVDTQGLYNLTSSGSPTFGVTGQFGTGVTFVAASSQYLQRALTNGSPLMVDLSDFTVAFWIKFTAAGAPAAQEGIMGTWSGNQYFWAVQRGTDGKIYLLLNHPTLGSATVPTGNTITNTTFHHLAVSVTRTANAVWYIDGVAETPGSVTAMTGITMNDPAGTEFNLGNIGTHLTGRYLPGTLDDVQFFLTALTGAEVLEVRSGVQPLAIGPLGETLGVGDTRYVPVP